MNVDYQLIGIVILSVITVALIILTALNMSKIQNIESRGVDSEGNLTVNNLTVNDKANVDNIVFNWQDPSRGGPVGITNYGSQIQLYGVGKKVMLSVKGQPDEENFGIIYTAKEPEVLPGPDGKPKMYNPGCIAGQTLC